MILEKLKAEVLLAMADDERRNILDGFARQQLNTIFGSRRPIDDDLLKDVCEKVFWKTCIRLTLEEARMLIRVYPEAAVWIAAPAGLNEHAIEHFTDVMCIFLTGTTWADNSKYREILTEQHRLIFKAITEHRERAMRGPARRPLATPIELVPRDVCPDCSTHGNSHVCHNNYHLRFK